MPDRPLTVLDELEILPGQLDDFLAAMHADYRPGAEARGMSLEHVWISPPFERPEGGTSVMLVWRIDDGAAGFWQVRSQSGSEEVERWWRRCDSFIVSRTRRIAAEFEDLSTLAAEATVSRGASTPTATGSAR